MEWTARVHFLPWRWPFDAGQAALRDRSRLAWRVIRTRVDADDPVPIGLVDDLARALMAELPGVAGAVSIAKTGTQRFEYPEYIDLGSFAAQLGKKLPKESKARGPAMALHTALGVGGGSLIVANRTWGNSAKRASGLSIYFPQPEDYSPDYATLEINQSGKWVAFLREFNRVALE